VTLALRSKDGLQACSLRWVCVYLNITSIERTQSSGSANRQWLLNPSMMRRLELQRRNDKREYFKRPLKIQIHSERENGRDIFFNLFFFFTSNTT